MTSGQGIYDNDEDPASQADNAEKDADKDTPDVDKNADEPTA